MDLPITLAPNEAWCESRVPGVLISDVGRRHNVPSTIGGTKTSGAGNKQPERS